MDFRFLTRNKLRNFILNRSYLKCGKSFGVSYACYVLYCKDKSLFLRFFPFFILSFNGFMKGISHEA